MLWFVETHVWVNIQITGLYLNYREREREYRWWSKTTHTERGGTGFAIRSSVFGAKTKRRRLLPFNKETSSPFCALLPGSLSSWRRCARDADRAHLFSLLNEEVQRGSSTCSRKSIEAKTVGNVSAEHAEQEIQANQFDNEQNDALRRMRLEARIYSRKKGVGTRCKCSRWHALKYHPKTSRTGCGWSTHPSTNDRESSSPSGFCSATNIKRMHKTSMEIGDTQTQTLRTWKLRLNGGVHSRNRFMPSERETSVEHSNQTKKNLQ